MESNYDRPHSKQLETFIPALQFQFLTPLYNLILAISGLGTTFKQKITTLAELPEQPGGLIIDVGCGSGLHAMILAHGYPSMNVIGFDPDPFLIATLTKNNTLPNLSFCEGFAQLINLPENSATYIFSSLTYHHLTLNQKEQAASETYRVLAPNGKFIFTDWGTLIHPCFVFIST